MKIFNLQGEDGGNIVQTRSATLEWQEPIVKIELAEDLFMDLNVVHEITNVMESMSKGRPYGSLVINQNVRSSSKDARTASADYTPDNLVATAIVNKTPVAVIMINFYLSMSKPKVPTKVFKTEQEATAWLNDMVSNG